MDLFDIIVIVLIVPLVVSITMSVLFKSKSDTDSIYDFTMKDGGKIGIIGIVGAIFFLICMIGASYSDQLSGGLAATFISLFLLCLVAVLSPIKGFWDIEVKQDDINITKLWFMKKHFKVSEVSHYEESRGEFFVYMNGSNKRAFMIDKTFKNINNWHKRMEAEGKEFKKLEINN